MDDRVSSVRDVAQEHDAALAELGVDVVAELDRARAERDSIARVRDRIALGIAPRFRAPVKKRVRPAAVAGVLALAATMILAIGFGATRRTPSASLREPAPAAPPISFTVASPETGKVIAASAKEETPVHFSDGSELRLAPAARVRVTETASNGARVLVETGAMHVSVVHRKETRWAIEAGPYEVEVTGTRFVVAWDPARNGLVVKMEEGSVLVKGCGLTPGESGQRLGAGEELMVSCSEKSSTVELPASPPPAEPAPASSPKPASKPVDDPTRAILALARAGENAEAIAAAEANGFDATLGALSGSELLLLASSARYAGKFEYATAALGSARNRFPGSDDAASAAFELGRIAMDVRRQHGVAGDQFEIYLRERPSGALAREAMGRAIEARSGAGEPDRARELATRYLASWPEGPHAALARRLTGAKR